MPREEVQEVRAMMGDSNSVYQRLANSIAPSVWGSFCYFFSAQCFSIFLLFRLCQGTARSSVGYC